MSIVRKIKTLGEAPQTLSRVFENFNRFLLQLFASLSWEQNLGSLMRITVACEKSSFVFHVVAYLCSYHKKAIKVLFNI